MPVLVNSNDEISSLQEKLANVAARSMDLKMKLARAKKTIREQKKDVRTLKGLAASVSKNKWHSKSDMIVV